MLGKIMRGLLILLLCKLISETLAFPFCPYTYAFLYVQAPPVFSVYQDFVHGRTCETFIAPAGADDRLRNASRFCGVNLDWRRAGGFGTGHAILRKLKTPNETLVHGTWKNMLGSLLIKETL
jgi:hypothetical protein